MTLLLLEALGALLLLVFIVWWTMFSGRKNGELKPLDEPDNLQDVAKPAALSATAEAPAAAVSPSSSVSPSADTSAHTSVRKS